MKTTTTLAVFAALFAGAWVMWPDDSTLPPEHAPVPHEERIAEEPGEPLLMDELLNAITALQLNAQSQLEAATPEQRDAYLEWYDESAWLALFGTSRPQ